MYHVILSVHVLACLGMILFVLLQTGRGAGLQVFGGGGDSLIQTPSGSSFMKKFTVGLAATFALTSLLLTVMQNHSGMSSVTSKVAEPPAPLETPTSSPAAAAPAAKAKTKGK